MDEAAPVSRTKARRRWAVALAALAALGQAPPAAAESSPADITGFSVRNVSVRSLGCKDVPVTMGVTQADDVSGTDVTTHIYRGTREIDYWFFQNNQPDTWLWCPHLDGYGTFRLGPSDLTIHTSGGTYTAVDHTTAYVKVKARGTEAIMGSARSRGVVTITSRSSYFNTNTGGYSRWRGAKVTFQYRLSAGAAWHSAATGYADNSGLATKRIAAPTVRYWRAVLAEGAQVFGAASPQIRR
jgi:hypothetical protein